MRQWLRSTLDWAKSLPCIRNHGDCLHRFQRGCLPSGNARMARRVVCTGRSRRMVSYPVDERLHVSRPWQLIDHLLKKGIKPAAIYCDRLHLGTL